MLGFHKTDQPERFFYVYFLGFSSFTPEKNFKIQRIPFFNSSFTLWYIFSNKHIGEYFRKLSNRLLLCYVRKVQRIYRWDNRRYSDIFPLHFVLTLNLFTSCIKPPSTAKINMANSWTSCTLRVRTHETTPRSAALWLAQKHERFLAPIRSQNSCDHSEPVW